MSARSAMIPVLGVSFLIGIFLEGWGVPFAGPTMLYLGVFVSGALTILTTRRKCLRMPRALTGLLTAFLIVSVVATYHSAIIPVSLHELLLFWSAILFLILGYALRSDRLIDSQLPRLIFGSSIFLAVSSLILRLVPLYIPRTGFNLILPFENHHNQLGNYLILPLITAGYLRISGRRDRFIRLTTLFLVPFFVLSFTRSGYLALVAGIFALGIRYRRLHGPARSLLIPIGLMGALGIMSLFVIDEAASLPGIKTIQPAVQKTFGIEEKPLLGGRHEYAIRALSAARRQPWFGLGPGNFLYASLYDNPHRNHWTATSHNIFLDVLVEQGIFALISLLAATGYLLIKSKKQLPFFLVLVLLVDFQFNYLFEFRTIFLSFFFFAGLSLPDLPTIKLDARYTPILLIPMLIAGTMLVSELLEHQGRYQSAHSVYPLNSTVYPRLIDDALAKNQSQDATQLLNHYSRLHPGRTDALIYAADRHLDLGRKHRALELYRRAYENRHFGLMPYQEIYGLTAELESQEQADRFAEQLFDRYAEIKETYQLPYYIRGPLIKFCHRVYDANCPHRL